MITVKKIAFFLLILVPALDAGQPAGTFDLGGRVGVFSNTEDDLATGSDLVQLFGNKTNIYIEAALGYYFLPQAALVANLGTYSKGDIRFEAVQAGVGPRTFFGSAAIYPIQLGIKLSPFRSTFPLRAQPFVEGGGALIIGTESINSLYYDYYRDAWVDGNIETETDWNWWAGAGVEIPVSRQIYIDFMAKYVNIDFSGDIAGILDYSGWQVSFGFGYLAIK